MSSLYPEEFESESVPQTNEEAGAPVELVAQLARALDESQVTYCHWKSNEAIARSESAENDLDLLVERSDAERFRAVLHELGYTRVERTTKPSPPGKEDFIGYDDAADRFVHVDVHYQLVLGHDRTKNYRIPVEAPYLASSRHLGLLKVPSPEFEYVIFVIRMVLKYAIWDEVLWKTLRGGRRGPKPSERRELVHLESLIDHAVVHSILQEFLPWMDPDLFDQCAAVARGEVSLGSQLAVGRRLGSTLEPFGRLGPLTDTSTRMWRRIELGIQSRLGREPRYRLSMGGAIVGVMGADGSGKSTALEEIERWLSDDFEMRTVHLGKPPWSLTTYGVRGSLKAGYVLRSKVFGRSAGSRADFLEPKPGIRSILWLACTARDRYAHYRRAQRFANSGGLVISDRYPHHAFETMEVAQIARITSGAESTRFEAAMARLEERYHNRIATPELLILLRVDPETAVARKTDEPSDYVRRRATEVWNINWDDAGVHVIDATKPPDLVAAEVKSLIWSHLT